MADLPMDKLAIASKDEDEDVAESWEDELDSDPEGCAKEPTPIAGDASKSGQKTDAQGSGRTGESERTHERPDIIKTTKKHNRTSHPFTPDTAYESPYSIDSPRTPTSPDRRPEKSTAVASRLIAAGLGVRVQRTEDQRRYDKAVRSQARAQKEKEIQDRKRSEEEAEAARRAIWDD